MIVPDRMTRDTRATADPDGTADAPSHPDEPARHGLLERGRNCDTIRHADRFAMLVDGDAYFATLRAALRRARHTVFIVGWDVDSRMHLSPTGADDGLPDTLAAFLHALAAARHNLRIYVLAWDFAMIYALERDWPPVYRAAWRAHRGIRFRLDDTHPRGASHHQKLLAIDDRLAFVGALDADVDCGAGTIRVVATHLGLSANERGAQVRRLLAAFDTGAMPVILMGDINEWFVRGRALQALVTHFRRAPAPRTFPTLCPVFSLDRIWIHPGELLIDVAVHRSMLARHASDQYPLVARMRAVPASGTSLA